MSENEMAGRVEQSVGGVEKTLGEALESQDLAANGRARKAKGQAREAAGKVQTKIDKVADQLSSTVARAGEKSRAVYEMTAEKVQKVSDQVRPVATERPYAVAGLALAAGVVIGMLLNSGGPKIIYVKPRA